MLVVTVDLLTNKYANILRLIYVYYRKFIDLVIHGLALNVRVFINRETRKFINQKTRK